MEHFRFENKLKMKHEHPVTGENRNPLQYGLQGVLGIGKKRGRKEGSTEEGQRLTASAVLLVYDDTAQF